MLVRASGMMTSHTHTKTSVRCRTTAQDRVEAGSIAVEEILVAQWVEVSVATVGVPQQCVLGPQQCVREALERHTARLDAHSAHVDDDAVTGVAASAAAGRHSTLCGRPVTELLPTTTVIVVRCGRAAHPTSRSHHHTDVDSPTQSLYFVSVIYTNNTHYIAPRCTSFRISNTQLTWQPLNYQEATSI